MTSVNIPKDPDQKRLAATLEIVKKLLKFFDYSWEYITKRNEDWQTITTHALDPRSFERLWLDPQTVLGVRFGNRTNVLCLDLDWGGTYNPYSDYANYRETADALRIIGINHTMLIRSSSNNNSPECGYHLFALLPQKVNTFNLACALNNLCYEHGWEPKGGELELFPNTKTYGRKGNKWNSGEFTNYQGLRVPFQPGSGSVIVDPETLEPVSNSEQRFYEEIEKSQGQDIELLETILAKARSRYYQRKFKKGYLSNDFEQNDWYLDLKYNLSKGYTNKGQTNYLLGYCAQMGRVFARINDQATLKAYIVERIKNLPGYSKFCSHQHEIEQRANDWSKSAMKRYTPWRSHPEERLPETYQEYQQRNFKLYGKYRHNLERAKKATRKLQRILESYPLEQMPAGVMARRRFIQEKCLEIFEEKFSINTLNKPTYRNLWHPKYVQQVDTICAVEHPITRLESAITHKNVRPLFNGKIILDAIARIAAYLTQNMNKLLEKLSSTKTPTTSKLQTQTIQDKKVTRSIAPPQCSMLNLALYSNASNPLTASFQEIDRTIMKGLGPTPLHVAYENSLSTKQFRTSEEKIKEINKLKRKEIYYHGLPISNLKARRGKLHQNKILDATERLLPGEKVKICNDIHSSTWSDDTREILVYVRSQSPNANKKAKYAIPINHLLVATEESYHQMLLAKIKTLVQHLGETKQDWLRFINTQYKVRSIRYLSCQEVYEAFLHYQNRVNNSTTYKEQKNSLAKLRITYS